MGFQPNISYVHSGLHNMSLDQVPEANSDFSNILEDELNYLFNRKQAIVDSSNNLTIQQIFSAINEMPNMVEIFGLLRNELKHKFNYFYSGRKKDIKTFKLEQTKNKKVLSATYIRGGEKADDLFKGYSNIGKYFEELERFYQMFRPLIEGNLSSYLPKFLQENRLKDISKQYVDSLKALKTFYKIFRKSYIVNNNKTEAVYPITFDEQNKKIYFNKNWEEFYREFVVNDLLSNVQRGYVYEPIVNYIINNLNINGTVTADGKSTDITVDLADPVIVHEYNNLEKDYKLSNLNVQVKTLNPYSSFGIIKQDNQWKVGKNAYSKLSVDNIYNENEQDLICFLQTVSLYNSPLSVNNQKISDLDYVKELYTEYMINAVNRILKRYTDNYGHLNDLLVVNNEVGWCFDYFSIFWEPLITNNGTIDDFIKLKVNKNVFEELYQEKLLFKKDFRYNNKDNNSFKELFANTDSMKNFIDILSAATLEYSILRYPSSLSEIH